MIGQAASAKPRTRRLRACALLTAAGLLLSSSVAAHFVRSEDEVPDYVLPDPLVMQDGRPVESARMWWEERRPEILSLFEHEVYGENPRKLIETRYELLDIDREALGGIATRKQVRVHFGEYPDVEEMDILIYLPNQVEGPAPLFVALNFRGNQTIHPDPQIVIQPERYDDDAERSRGQRVWRWPVESILARGYGLATIFNGDLPPRLHDIFHEAGQTEPPPHRWGTIGSRSWGLMRAMDYFVADPQINERRVAVAGHSRLGKAALWAGAQDQRFAMVISNDSGCGGAALSRRHFGENLQVINQIFPNWFTDNFKAYIENEDALPVDQHMLIALTAPRPVYVASASLDTWADPKGEFLSAKHAEPVYQLLGAGGMDADAFPPPGPVTSIIGHHLREGEHDIQAYDWERFMDFADIHMREDQCINPLE